MNEKFKDKYRIKSTRLRNWNYSSNGYYFITICTKNRECFFGEICDYKMILNEMGIIIKKYWFEIPIHFNNIKLDEFVVMPNHVHGILIIDNDDENQCRDEAMPRLYIGNYPFMAQISPKPKSLSVIIGSYKSICSKQIHKNNQNFEWQSRFHDRIIRDEKELFHVREYIKNNPLNWIKDRNYKNIFI